MRRFYILGRRRLVRHGLWLVAHGLEHTAKELGYEARTFFLNPEDVEKLPRLNDSDILCVLCDSTLRAFGKALQGVGGILCLYNFTEIVVGGDEERWSIIFQESIKACGRSPDVVFNYSPLPISWFRGLGFTAIYLPLGYSPAFEMTHSRSRRTRYDASLLGNQTDKNHQRRYSVIKRLKRDGFRVGSIKLPKMVETEYNIKEILKRNQELLNTALWLHVHRRKTHQSFTDIRIVGWGMSNRLCVVSESCVWSPPFRNGVHWVVVEPHKFIGTVRALLNHDPARRLRIAQTGYEFIKTKWRYVDHLQQALESAGV